MSNSKFKLTYFNVKGYAEGIRFILAHVDADFEDNRIKREDWPALKEKQPYGTVPVLEVDGKVLNQSVAISRYLGRRFGLVTNDPWIEAQSEALVDNLRDTITKMQKLMVDKTPEKEKEAGDALKYLFDRLEKLVVDGYFFGKLTWVDFYFVGLAETMKDKRGDIIVPYPNLAKVVSNVTNLPNVKKYIANKPTEDAIIRP